MFGIHWFLRRASCKARLLVITSVSDLVVHLVFFVQIRLFHVCQAVTFTKRIKMAVLFWIFFWSDLSKMDKTWSNWISHQSKNVNLKSCHTYKKDNNGCFILDFFESDLSKMDQTWSNLIKLDFSQIKKCFSKKFSHLKKG